ncbi:C-type lectin domain family 10 member A-like [Discoglossus pictus]
MKFCKQNGSHLAKVESLMEEHFLESRVNGSYWIGLTKKDDVWVWVDGSILDKYSESFWINLQPDNRGGIENCVTIQVSPQPRGNRGWNDDVCARQRKFICEKEITAAVFKV